MLIFVFCFAILALPLVILYGIKMYLKIKSPPSRTHACLVRKTVLITGANKGMGYWVALDFAKRGARVILACRSKQRAEEAQKKIMEATGNSDIAIKIVNLASFKSIKAFAYEILKTESRLDILVNNAGVVRPNGITEDGFHPTLQVNALGPFLLTILFLDLLKSTKGSRVVNVTTLEGTDFRQIPDNFVDRTDGYLSFARNYTHSKKCLTLLMLELASLFKHYDVLINFSIPRRCRTDIQMYENLPEFWAWFRRNFIFKFFFVAAEAGAENTIHSALREGRNVQNVKFYRDCHEHKIKDDPNLDILQKATFKKCLEFVKIKLNEGEVTFK